MRVVKRRFRNALSMPMHCKCQLSSLIFQFYVRRLLLLNAFNLLDGLVYFLEEDSCALCLLEGGPKYNLMKILLSSVSPVGSTIRSCGVCRYATQQSEDTINAIEISLTFKNGMIEVTTPYSPKHSIFSHV